MSEETPKSRAETNGHLLGISTGWEQAAAWLLEQAVKSFTLHNDDEAHVLRSFSAFAKRTSEERRRDYETYKQEVED